MPESGLDCLAYAEFAGQLEDKCWEATDPGREGGREGGRARERARERTPDCS